jgi:Zn-finger nucleic acid-binding protein
VKCPKDESEMDEVVFDGVTIDVCRKCNGLWMDRGELNQLGGFHATEHELMHRGESPLSCPRCGKRMMQADIHAVIVDVCACGIYFDEGEAEKVIGRKIQFRNENVKRVDVTREQLKKLADSGSLRIGDLELALRR